jgi:hypothetical protein
MCVDLGVEHITTTAYHPQSNGLVERVHRQLKDALRARQAGDQWPRHLAWVLLGIRAAPKEISNFSSAEAVYGQQVKLPGEHVDGVEEAPGEFAAKLASEAPPPTCQPRTWAQVAATPPSLHLEKCKFVYIKRGGTVTPLSQLYDGPFEVVKRGKKICTVQMGTRHETVSIDRLKPHLGSEMVKPAEPRLRGRPRKKAS